MHNTSPFLVLVDSAIPDSIFTKVRYCLDVLFSDYVAIQLHTKQQQDITDYQLIYLKEAPEHMGASSVYIPFILSDWEKSAADFWDVSLAFDRHDLLRQIFAILSDEVTWELYESTNHTASNYEDLPDYVDQHGRFNPTKKELKTYPEVLIESFYKQFEGKQLLTRTAYKNQSGVVLSFDIDNLFVGWKGLAYRIFKGSPFFPISKLSEEREVFARSVHKIIDRLEQYQLKAIFYLKAPINTHRFDAKDYINSTSLAVETLLTRIKEHPLIEVGFHSSYLAADNSDLFVKELNRLEGWLDKPIFAHRSHYLRFQLPTFYESVKGTSIQFDSSIAWSETPNSRVGIKRVYPLFHFKDEAVSSIKEIPLSFMDSQMCTSTKCTIEEIKDKLEQQISDMRTNGCCISWDFHHLVFDELLNPKNAPVFEYALKLISQNSIQTFHSHELQQKTSDSFF